MFNSDAKQDVFVANILNFKENGFYIDVGANDSKISNNSFYFSDSLKWKGICVEYDPSYISSFSNRKNCTILQQDATSINYKDLFIKNNFPKEIDYLSLDVDTKSLEVLRILPLDEYQFKVLTIEHDFYLYGDLYQSEQRKILKDNGYSLICGDVFVQQPNFHQNEASFEDWWIHPKFFNEYFLKKIQSEREYPSNIISKFNN
jgi:hypothetical protein